ncbi:hypothetical protein E2C01_090473 [Portunus trituberculatus]|uniref:Major facilitator superfamily (MFS) profile domain-containing protein n=1 Tax=Portunus trituberculatus TaxID=210409 RepID=A0A5B7JBI4_PORTR|nr:hypothetical protein [Portunus trituberculatus]
MTGGEVESRLFPVFCFIGITLGNAAGMSTLPTMIVMEYFPTSSRAQAYSTLVEALTLAGLYWQYALISVAAIFHVLFFIQETNQQNIG